MSLLGDLEKDSEAINRVEFLLEHYQDLGVRGGLAMDKLKSVIYKDWIKISDIQEHINRLCKKTKAVMEENDRLKELMEKML